LDSEGGGRVVRVDLEYPVSRDTAAGAAGIRAGIALTYGTQWLMKHAVPASLVQETVYAWWPIRLGLPSWGAAGGDMPGMKAVKQDVTEALSYE